MASCNFYLYFRVLLLAPLLPWASGDCIDLDLGMESKAILDSQISASSELNGSTQANHSRLKYTAGMAWCASTSESSPYLQIDLKTLHIICAVSTQGNAKSTDWVKTFTIQTSTDESTWTDYKDFGQVKTFTGNGDQNTVKKNILYEGVLTRWLRFVVKTTHDGFSCMRTEVFGVKYKPENLAAGKTTGQSSTYLSAGSAKAVDGNANTNYNDGHCSHTQLDNSSWWRVDLGSDYVPVSEVQIVNRFSQDSGIQQRNQDYKITLGNSATVTRNPECVGRYTFIQFIASAVCYRNPLKTGRYLGIMTTKQQFLQLCEVEVYSRENIAYNKPTDQVSTGHSFGVSSKAVDGNSNTDFNGKSCTHTEAQETNPWWRVDLGQVEPVTEVYIVNRDGNGAHRLNPFEIRVGTESSNGGINNPKCGDGGYSVPEGKGASFFCRPSLRGRYVTIRITKRDQVPLTLCEVEVYSARRACPIQALGLVSSNAFPNSSFSALTSGSANEAYKGRLNGNGAWSPSTNGNPNDYLQINLQYEFFICAVATQGSPTADHWTKKYKLLLSLNDTDWVTYQESNTDKIFNANDGKNDIVKHMLVGINRARFIRFQPTDYNSAKALRVEVYGLLKPGAPSQGPPSFTVTAVSSVSITASWQLPQTDARIGIITGFKLSYKKKNSAGSPTNTITINDGSTVTKTVAGLAKYTEYEFKVLAFNYFGDGPWSSVVSETTMEDAPSQAPTSFTLTAASSSIITANWQLPPADYRNGIITGFKLSYKKKNPAGSPNNTETINDGSTFTKTVTGLAKYTDYEFQVLAFTSVGDGPWSIKKYETTMEDAPSQAPTSFTLTAASSTSITANWQLPPADYRNGIITGFKLSYKKKNPAGSPNNTETINDGSTLTKTVTWLAKYTDYEFQVLAFTSVGDGPWSPEKSESTMEDAPSAPEPLDHSVVPPSAMHGPRINLSWSIPHDKNGIIRNYTVFFSHNEGQHNVQTETFGAYIFSYIISVFGGVSYQFNVSAVTVKPGTNASLFVDIPEYAPTVGPENVTFFKMNESTFNISWASLTRDYGTIISYEVTREKESSGLRSRRSNIDSSSINSTETFAVLHDFALCSSYYVSVRGYTRAGPGIYSPNMVLQTSKPDNPKDLTVKGYGDTDVTLEWKPPLLTPKEGLDFTIKYTGKKDYDKHFLDPGSRNAIKASTYTLTDLFPGTSYSFEVYGVSKCGNSLSLTLNVDTDIAKPLAPDVNNVSEISVSESSAVVQLWPAKQRNGPISAYQVIVQKGGDGVTDLPSDYELKLKDSKGASDSNLQLYIAAEMSNYPVRKVVWKFTIGDKKDYGGYLNSALEKGQVYNVYQRAITLNKNKNVVLEGAYIKVAKISVAKVTNNSEGTKGSFNTTAVVVPVVLLLLFVPLVVIALLFYRRRKLSQRESNKKVPIQLDDIGSGTPQSTTSTTNLVYQNVMEMDATAETSNQIYQNVRDNAKSKQDGRIYQNTKKDTKDQPANQVYQNVADMSNGKDAKAPPFQEPIYSEAEDGKPRPIIASEFASYFKSKSSNGAAVLRQEFKDLPGDMLSTWEVAKSNKIKNRYGNIVTYDHSRVVLDEIEGDPKSDYINATYIPTYDEKTMCYIATQGPNAVTINDFWRMIWQENCTTIVMLTNLIEQGKVKCEQYWPEDTSKFGAITVTVQKIETFADYLIRTFILVKDSEKREVLQYHYITWPDRGVPHHSTALLAFRWKVHVKHKLAGGPLVVHCSAGVGRTGTFIAIDAMLESAKEQNSVFIPHYVHVMRKRRPHMIQKEEQYVFLHQAVMEALVCGNTEIAPHDLLIRMNKLARVHKSSKRTGYSQEFKRLQFISESEGSEDKSATAFKPANIKKNRFPNIVPLDNARLFLRSSDPDKDYINASFVDDHIQRNAYVLTQAPLDNTISDFWRMVSQYDIGTVVMLNNLKEGKQVYTQYWPSEGVVRYGDISLEMLSEFTANNITTRKFRVLNAEPPKKTSTVHHIQFTGWTDANSCPDPKEVIQVLTAIQKSQQQTGNGVIVFQCSDGVGRSGVVSTIMSTIERIKNEQTVDVFQTVNLIRVKRPGAVANVEQYTFCYKIIQAYLDSFSAYSNFSEC